MSRMILARPMQRGTGTVTVRQLNPARVKGFRLLGGILQGGKTESANTNGQSEDSLLYSLDYLY